MPNVTLPLFPLHGALLPGAGITLRVFEQRYLDLLRECSNDSSSFGVCLIMEGTEVGKPAKPAPWGVEARIEDFDLGADGVLLLRLRGARRFRVDQVAVRDNGLVVGQVQWCAADNDDEIRAEHALLSLLLERIIEQVGGPHAKAGPELFDQAAWVGWRLAELMPLEEAQRLVLLQLDDPHRRLDLLLEWIPD
jgi:Lon protease-like protein